VNGNSSSWEEITLGEFGEVVAGGTPSRSNSSYWNGSIRWVTPGEIKNFKSKYLCDTREKITDEGLAASAAKLLPVGSLLVTTRATLGEVAIAAVPVATNQGFKNIVPNEKTDPIFAYYRIRSLKQEMERLASGTTFLEISKTDFSRIKTWRPLLEEQSRIAAVLDTVDEAIAKTEAVIAKLKQLRAGLLHDLLTRGLDENGQLRDPVAHPEQFQDSPLGRIPREWEVGVLNDLVRDDRPIVYGILMPGRGFPGGMPVIKVKDIKNGRIDLSDLLLTDPRIDESYQRSRVLPGDLLFTIRGTVGRMALVPPVLANANITQDTARVSLETANPMFVARWLEMEEPSRFVAVHTIGVAVRGINLADVRKIPIPIVSREEHDAIIDCLESIERETDKELEIYEKLRVVKSGLMNDLLTGRVRVPEGIAVTG
jgi:type I restriction enzyme S subunit